MNLDAYLDSSGSDSADELPDPEPVTSRFATAATVGPCAQSINLHLRGMGFKTELKFFSSAPEDVAEVLNVMDTLLRQKHGDQTESSRLENHLAHLRVDNDVLLKDLKRAQKQLEDKEKEIGNLMIKVNRAESSAVTDASKSSRELEQLQTSHKKLAQLHACWQQELRRREREYTALQDKLRFHLQERKREANKAVVEIAGITQMDGGAAKTPPAARSSPAASRRADEEVQKRIVEHYERIKAELTEENDALKRGMLDLQTEYKELLNQLQDGKHHRSYMSMRRVRDSIDGSLTSGNHHTHSGDSHSQGTHNGSVLLSTCPDTIPEHLDTANSCGGKAVLQQVAAEAEQLIAKSSDVLCSSRQPFLGQPASGKIFEELSALEAVYLARKLEEAHTLIREQQQAMQRWREVAV